MSNVKVKWERILKMHPREFDLPLVEWLNLGNGTMFRVMAFSIWKGKFYTETGLVLAIERIGAAIFSSHSPFHGDHVSEKLNLATSDANIIADWLNAQFAFKINNQGEYNSDLIGGKDETYNLMGETPRRIIQPIIIETEEWNVKKT